MKAVMYGGGNIGRGFIGALLSQSGYHVTFIDVAEPVVNALKENESYPVRYVSSEGYEDVTITNVSAVNGNDLEAASDAIAECDIMATAVGARILKFIVPNVVEGIRKRWARGGAPLNIIICENLNDANKIFEGMLKEQMTPEECKKFDETVGLVEASIGRMVPVQTDEMKDGEPMRVCVERYGFLPTDKAAFKGDIPDIKNMVPFEPFDFYIKRKLFVHNMGHATCAYLGDTLGLDYIFQSIDVPDIRIIVQNAMIESAMALNKKYGADLDAILLHVTDLLNRFTNAALKDTCQRVGGDPARKLAPADRMIGSSKLALEMGITPAYITVGAAAAVRRYINENEGMEQGIESAKKVLREVSGLEFDDAKVASVCKVDGESICEEDAGNRLAAMILYYYRMFLDGRDLAYIRRAADTSKNNSLHGVI